MTLMITLVALVLISIERLGGIHNSPVKRSNRIHPSPLGRTPIEKYFGGRGWCAKRTCQPIWKGSGEQPSIRKIGRQLVLKIRYARITLTLTRQKFEEATRDPEVIQRLAQELYQSLSITGIHAQGDLTNFQFSGIIWGSLIEETP